MKSIATISCVYLATAALLMQSTSAWVFSKKDLQKAASAATCAAVVSLVATPFHANARDFSGSYNDPNHPNCIRKIENIGKIATIYGTDGNPGCPANGKGTDFDLLASVVGDEIQIDFGPKGGPKAVMGKWDETGEPGITFPDGNKWTLKDKK
jgi:hypothetical protein